MPSRKKKYNARFPAGRIKKIMQSDEEIGKVAQAVPVIISRTLELFVESLLKKSLVVTNTRNAKTISLSHMKYTIMQENRFDFLRELVKNIPDMGISDDGCNDDSSESPEEQSATNTKPNICYYSPQEQPINLSCNRAASTSSGNNLNGSSTAATTSRNTSYLHSTPSTSVQPQYSTTTFNNNSIKTPTTSSRNSGRNIQNQSSSSPSVAAAADNNENQALRLHLKRQWENVSRMRTQINDNDSMKLLRANSTPATPSDSSSINRSSTTPNQRSRGRTRGGGGGGLVHQPKSVPTTPLSPIVKIEFTNEPIIKIDFTNTNLQDNSQISSSSTLTATGSRTGDQGVGGGSFSTAGADLGPVVNIDLSNICTASLTTPTVATVTSPAVTIVPTASSKLELDEDYDNI